MTKTLAKYTANELKQHLGKNILTKELGGDILVATLVGVNVDNNNKIRSVKVIEHPNSQTIITWPTQWQQAVIV